MFPKTIVANSKTIWRDDLRWEEIPNSNRSGLVDSAAWNLTYKIFEGATWHGFPDLIGWRFILEPAQVSLAIGSHSAQAILSRADAPATRFVCKPISFMVVEDFSICPRHNKRS